jgi:hypothetical protein
MSCSVKMAEGSGRIKTLQIIVVIDVTSIGGFGTALALSRGNND